MVTIVLPAKFQRSFTHFGSYPESIIPNTTSIYHSTLVSFKERLDSIEPKLCLNEGTDEAKNDFEIPIRDLATAEGRVYHKKNIHSPQELTDWLGATIVTDQVDPSKKTVVAKRRDPKSRFIYIYGEDSRDKLKTTRSSLVEILSYHQVMPTYLDFMFVFGAQSDPTDLRFGGFREQVMMKKDTAEGLSIPELGRSGRQFQLCYNLKGVSFKQSDNDNFNHDEWSIRQAAVYHQFDVAHGTALWIVTKGRLDLQERYRDLTGANGRPEDRSFSTLENCFRSSLAPHLLFSHWATEDWRWYIRWLESVIDAKSSMAIYGPRGPGYAHREYKAFDLQDMQYWQDKTSEAVMVLESNVDVIRAIQKFYFDLKQHHDFPQSIKEQCGDDLTTFDSHLREVVNNFKMQISRAKLLAGIIRDRKELILQHLQGQASERTEELNKNLEREAIVMRIITIVTLIYLPATFVSTFFSTDVVKYQNQGTAPGNGIFSSTALYRWLQVALPLTAVTLLVAWATYKITKSTRQKSKRIRDIEKNPEQQPKAPSGRSPKDPAHLNVRVGWPFVRRLLKASRGCNWTRKASVEKPSGLP